MRRGLDKSLGRFSWDLPASALQTCSHQMAQQHGLEYSKCNPASYFSRNSQILLLILNLQHCFKHNMRMEKNKMKIWHIICIYVHLIKY